jgi:hypothetical protein
MRVLRHGVRAAVALGVAACVLCAATGALADDAKVGWGLAPDGSGVLFATAVTGPTASTLAPYTWSWDVCSPDGTNCTPFTTGQQISTSGAPADVAFRAFASDGEIATSPTWYGPLTILSAPSVTGTIQANDLVTPVAATWGGGWYGDGDQLQLAACQNADGSDCTTLTDLHYDDGGCPNGAAVIDPTFTGDYLRVADMRVSVDYGFETYVTMTPYHPGEWTGGPTVAVAVVGQIAPATGPRQANCGPPPIGSATTTPPPAPQGPTSTTGTVAPAAPIPTVPAATATAAKPGVATVSKTGVARVDCTGACTIELTARHASHTVHVRRTLTAPAQITLRIPKSKLRRLGHGRATFTITVDGRPRATRTIRLR